MFKEQKSGVLIASNDLFLTRMYKWERQGDVFPEWQYLNVLQLAEGFKDRTPTHFFIIKNGEIVDRFDKTEG